MKQLYITAILVLGATFAFGQQKHCDPCKVQERLYKTLDSMYTGKKQMIGKDSLYNLFMVNNFECQRLSIQQEKVIIKRLQKLTK